MSLKTVKRKIIEMNQNVETNLDGEFKKYLQILRPHLGQLIDQNVIDICNAWIKKLSHCKENEKVLRNKYIFDLCYQLAKGVLEEPFLKPPPPSDLPPLRNISSSDISFTEVEYLVIDSNTENAKVNNEKETSSQIFTDDSGINKSTSKQTFSADTNCDFHNTFSDKNSFRTKCIATVQNYNVPYVNDNLATFNDCNEHYQFRATNLIMKLREIKKQNILWYNEFMKLKQANKRDINELLDDSMLKIDNTTSTDNLYECDSTLTTLKNKLQETQQSRNNLIERVATLQDKIDYFNEIKKHEIDEIEAKHKLEIIKLRSIIREEVKDEFLNKLADLKKQYEKLVLEVQSKTKEEIEEYYKSKEQVIAEKDKLLQMKETEMATLKRQLDEIKNNQFSMLSRFLDGSTENRNDSAKTYDLEKRLYKMERTKNKCAKAYEAKLASLQREKHLAECSLQLQLVKQRAQVLNEVTEENQVELATALDQLENKYKEIVANVQATAVQRRVQDQIALGSLIQAVCGALPKENSYMSPTKMNSGQLPGKHFKNQGNDRNRNDDREYATLCKSHRVDNVIVENKSFGDDSVGTGYCLDNEKLQELFDKVHIPQRDFGDVPK